MWCPAVSVGHVARRAGVAGLADEAFLVVGKPCSSFVVVGQPGATVVTIDGAVPGVRQYVPCLHSVPSFLNFRMVIHSGSGWSFPPSLKPRESQSAAGLQDAPGGGASGEYRDLYAVHFDHEGRLGGRVRVARIRHGDDLAKRRDQYCVPPRAHVGWFGMLAF